MINFRIFELLFHISVWLFYPRCTLFLAPLFFIMFVFFFNQFLQIGYFFRLKNHMKFKSETTHLKEFLRSNVELLLNFGRLSMTTQPFLFLMNGPMLLILGNHFFNLNLFIKIFQNEYGN